MNTMLVHVEDALCWTILAPVVRARRRRLERRISQEVYDRQRIDRVLNEIVEQGDPWENTRTYTWTFSVNPPASSAE